MIQFLSNDVKTINFFAKPLLILMLCLATMISCNEQKNPAAKTTEKTKSIHIQPLNGFDSLFAKAIASKLNVLSADIVILPDLHVPLNALNASGKRFRADSIIRFLKNNTPKDCITLGLIEKDISTTKGNQADWGVMGLGYRPGNACVASTFRLSKQNKQEQLFKISIHELGHTIGLPHCAEKTCYMRDAEGRNPTNEEKEFCAACKQKLSDLGWNLKSL